MTGFDLDKELMRGSRVLVSGDVVIEREGARALVTEALEAAKARIRAMAYGHLERRLALHDACDVIDALIPKPPAPPTSKKDTMTETAWLIEDRTCPTTLYWGPTSGCHSQWTTPDLAVRFVSREDALRTAAAIARVGQHLEAHEHAWPVVPPEPPDPDPWTALRAVTTAGKRHDEKPWCDCCFCAAERVLASKPKEAHP